MIFAIVLMGFVGQPTLLYFANPRSDAGQVVCMVYTSCANPIVGKIFH